MQNSSVEDSSTNSTNATTTSAWETKYKLHYLVWFIVINVVSLLGAGGNLCLLIVVYRQRRTARRSGSHILIGNLTLSYMLMCCPLMLFSSAPIMAHAYGVTVPVFYCRHILAITFFVYTVGVWTDVALAVNRIFAVFVPYKFTACCGKRFNLALVICIWIMSLMANSPFWLEIDSYTIFVAGQNCTCLYSQLTATGHILMYFSSVLPLAMTGLASLAVLIKSAIVSRKRRASLIGVLPLTFNLRQYWVVRRRLVLAKTIFVSFFWCALCNLPTIVLSLAYSDVMDANELLDIWLKTVVVVGYTFSPVIFFALNDDYLRGLNILQADIRNRINSNS